jgi:hypothetical protein
MFKNPLKPCEMVFFFAYLEARTCGAIAGKVRSLEVNFDH